MHSRYVQRVRRRYAGELACLPPGVPTRELQRQALTALREQGLDMPSALRVLRQLVLERLSVLDCELQAPLPVITLAMTHLAEIALDEACKLAWADLDARYGAPVIDPNRESMFGTLADTAATQADSGPQRAQMWVVGMGKLGARELNVSSDIDLIYVYDHDGETAGNELGRNRISNHEYFGKAVKHIYSTVGDSTVRCSGSTWPCDPTATRGRAQCRWGPWKSISWCRDVNGSALPGSRAG